MLEALVSTLADERVARRLAAAPRMQMHLYQKLRELRAPQPSLVLDPVRWAPHWRRQITLLQHHLDRFRSHVLGRVAASEPFIGTSVRAPMSAPPVPILPGQVSVTFIFSDGATPEEAQALFRRVFSSDVLPLLERQRERLHDHWTRAAASAGRGTVPPRVTGPGARPARDIHWMRSFLRDGADPAWIASEWRALTEGWHRRTPVRTDPVDPVLRAARAEWRATRSRGRAHEAPTVAEVRARLSAWLGSEALERP